jgi:hypothetical protein
MFLFHIWLVAIFGKASLILAKKFPHLSMEDGYLGHKKFPEKKHWRRYKRFKVDLFLVLLLSPFFSQDSMRDYGWKPLPTNHGKNKQLIT